MWVHTSSKTMQSSPRKCQSFMVLPVGKFYGISLFPQDLEPAHNVIFFVFVALSNMGLQKRSSLHTPQLHAHGLGWGLTFNALPNATSSNITRKGTSEVRTRVGSMANLVYHPSQCCPYCQNTNIWFNDHGITVIDKLACWPDLKPVKNQWITVRETWRTQESTMHLSRATSWSSSCHTAKGASPSFECLRHNKTDIL